MNTDDETRPLHDEVHRPSCACGRPAESRGVCRKHYLRLWRTGALPSAFVNAIGTIRRLQALVAIGYPQNDLAARLDMLPGTFSPILHGKRARVAARTHSATCVIFIDLWAHPVDGHPGERSRALARSYGWVGPLAWDDIDDPSEVANVVGVKSDLIDDIAVELAVSGEKVKLTSAERREAVRQLHRKQWNDQRIAAILRIADRTVLRIRQELGLAAFDRPERKAETSMKKLLEANVAYGRRRISQVFSDFCELAALAIRNSIDLNGNADREARYLGIIAGYTPEEADRFAQLLARLVDEFEAGFGDILGKLYMSLDLGSDRLGQFFTPFEVSSLMAQMTIGDYTAKLAGQAFITVNEPTCGSGGMVIALADALRSAGINYQTSMHVTAQDIELTAVHMTYVQLSLLNVPAVVIHGNTLTLEQHDVWPTPAHVLGGWSLRLRNRAAIGAALALTTDPVTTDVTLAEPEQEDASVTYIAREPIDLEGIA